MPFSRRSSLPTSSKCSRSTSRPTLLKSEHKGSECATLPVRRYPPIQKGRLMKPANPSSHRQRSRRTSILSWAIQSNHHFYEGQLRSQETSLVGSPSTAASSPKSSSPRTVSPQPALYGNGTSSPTRRFHSMHTYPYPTKNETGGSYDFPESEQKINSKALGRTSQKVGNSSSQMHSASAVLLPHADTKIHPPSWKSTIENSNLKSSKGGMKCLPRAKASIFKNRRKQTIQGYVRKNNAPVHLIDCTENSENDIDDLDKKFRNGLRIFDEDDNGEVNRQPASDDEIIPNAIGFSEHAQLELLKGMKQLGCEMMNGEHKTPLGIRRDERKVRKTRNSDRWKSLRTFCSRGRRDNVAEAGRNIDVVDDTSAYAVHSIIQPSQRSQSPTLCRNPGRAMLGDGSASWVSKLCQQSSASTTQNHILLPEELTPFATNEQLQPSSPPPNISRAILILDDSPPPPPPLPPPPPTANFL